MFRMIYLVLFSSILLIANDFITYSVDGKKYEAYYSSSSKNAPLVYLVHDWDGITNYEIKRAKMLNKMGYSVFAVDMFGKGIRPSKISDKRKLTAQLYKDRKKMRKLLYAGLDIAKKQGANINNAIALGYCFGGTVILEFARSGVNLKKFVSFHGGLSTPKDQDYSNVKAPIVIFHGSADKVVSIKDFASLVESLESSNVNHEMITYSGAPHAFSVFDSDKYNKEADIKSWKRFSEILEETF